MAGSIPVPRSDFKSMKVTWEEVILLTLPFTKEIYDWCKSHPEFQKGLKALASDRFLHLGTKNLTYPSVTKDEVIGIYAYDYKLKNPLFKQDFIVDINGLHKEFILYTGFEKGFQNTKYVKHINNFIIKYGKNGEYGNSHHLTFDQLPDNEEVRRRAIRMIERSKDLPKDITHPPQKMLDDFYEKLKKERVFNN
jgi:hypothetical protein